MEWIDAQDYDVRKQLTSMYCIRTPVIQTQNHSILDPQRLATRSSRTHLEKGDHPSSTQLLKEIQLKAEVLVKAFVAYQGWYFACLFFSFLILAYQVV